MLPPTCIASAAAASFALSSIIAYKSSSTVSVSPGSIQTDDPSTPTASFGTVTISLKHAFSSATSAVIILVVLAIGKRSFAFFSYMSVPVSASMSIAARAETDGALALMCGARQSAQKSTHAASFDCPFIFTPFPSASAEAGKIHAYLTSRSVIYTLKKLPCLRTRSCPF